MRLWLVLLLCCLCSTANAQFFRGRQTSNCPGGVCPTETTVNQMYSQPRLTPSPGPIQNVVQSFTAPGHWSFPGTINNHLLNDHGVDVSRMSREQQLDLHDSLHNGTSSFSIAVPNESNVCTSSYSMVSSRPIAQLIARPLQRIFKLFRRR